VPEESTIQPGRALLRLAGVFTQVACAGCLLLGTIAFVLIHQNQSGGVEYAITWAAAAMIGLVFGGLMVRGGLITLLGSALIDIAFGSVLLVIDKDSLAGMLRVLAESDVATVADALFGAAIALIVVGVLCFAAIPQAIRYTRWLHAGESGDFAAASSPGSARTTNPGFPPPPIPAAKSTMWRAPTAPAAERRSRRRMYFALAGFAIGFGAGIGVLVSSTTRSVPPSTQDGGDDDPGTDPGVGPGWARNSGMSGNKVGDRVGSGSNHAPGPGVPVDAGIATPVAATATVKAMLQDQRDAIARGDLAGLIATVSPSIIGFGIDGDELIEGKAAAEAQVKRDLGGLADGTVEVKFSHVGQQGNAAWIAEDLELSSPGKPARRIALTQLAAVIGGSWRVVAWHWAAPVRDDAAERLALLGTKPPAKAITSKLDGPKPLDVAVHAAFASRAAFVDARSERDDAFNFGSGPQERIVGGSRIKKIFDRLRAEIRLHDGARVVAAGAWDPAQKAAPEVGFALVNADFTAKTRAATDLTQTFRVLAVLIREGTSWKIVLTQWSHAGPIR